MAEIDDVGREQAEQDKSLSPLRCVAPKEANILQDERAPIRPDEPQEAEESLGHSGSQGGFTPSRLTSLNPFPTRQDTAAAVHRRRGLVKHRSHARKRDEAEEQRIAQQHRRKEPT